MGGDTLAAASVSRVTFPARRASYPANVAEPDDPRLGTTVAGYRLDERLGAGGMGVVYKGTELDGGRTVAVKFLHDELAHSPDLVKRFKREIVAMRRLVHAHAVGVIDSGTSGNVPYLVMEFQSGRPLSKLLERASLPPARAVGIARQVLAALAAAHGVGVVHRDLKPDNILMMNGVAGDVVKILDFGLAKLAHGSGEATTELTRTGLVLGTPGYMAPEQAKGGATDERTDLYAVGVILYHMVTGRRPFVADSPLAVLRMHADDPPLPPRKAAPDAGISADLEAVILRALEKPPAARWASADEFAAAIEATPEGRASSIPLVEVSLREVSSSEPRTRLGKRRPSQKRPPARRWLRWAEAAVGAAALAGLAFFGWTRLSHRDQTQVKQKLDTVVDGAKGALRSLAPKPAPPRPAVDDDADEPPPRDTPGARQETAARAAPSKRPPRLADAARLLAAGKTDDAIQTLYALRKQSPRSGEVALLLGHAYFAKVWRTDALREYDTAVQLRPSLRGDRTLLRNTVAALDDPTFKTARALIRNRLGASALPELRRAEQGAKNPLVQKRAAKLAPELAHLARAKDRR